MDKHLDPISVEKQIIMSLKGFRRSKKITQTELANRIGVSRDTIARIESGKARIYLAQAVAMADALDIMLQDLLMQDEQKEEIAENMSLSQQNVHVTYKTKLLPSPARHRHSISNVAGGRAGRSGVRRSPSIESPPPRRGDVETTVVDLLYYDGHPKKS